MRDARTQFYIAYSYHPGLGVRYYDDVLYAKVRWRSICADIARV